LPSKSTAKRPAEPLTPSGHAPGPSAQVDLQGQMYRFDAKLLRCAQFDAIQFISGNEFPAIIPATQSCVAPASNREKPRREAVDQVSFSIRLC
jgi:hypothetical protein